MPRRKKDENGKAILTAKDQLFVEGLAQGKSQAQAARDAGYSPKIAAQIAHQKLATSFIQEAYQTRIQAIKADADEVLALLSSHLRADFADFADCVSDDGRFNWVELQRRGISRLIKKIKVKARMALSGVPNAPPIPEIETEIELYNAQDAAWKLAQIFGMQKRAAANPEDVEWAKSEVARLVAKGYTEEEARHLVIEACPQANDWLH